MDSQKAPVVILVAIILMAAIIWVVWAIRSASDIDPERAKSLAKEAERECVLRGFEPERCPKLVGRHHQECLERTQKESEGALLDESVYIDCMTEEFGEPEDASPDTGRADGPDGGASDDASGESDGDRDAGGDDAGESPGDGGE